MSTIHGTSRRRAGRAANWPIWACASLLAFASPFSGEMIAAGVDRPVMVIDAWSRATPPGVAVGAAYFEVVNPGAADELIRISSPAARRVQIHLESTVDGLMQMRPMETVVIPAGGRVRFKPGGTHAMLMELAAPLARGGLVPLTIDFKRSGRIRVDAVIVDAR